MADMTKAQFSNWREDYNWESSDNQQLKQYGEYLSAYLRNQHQQLVLNLNGEWGSGKTQFLKQLYCDLAFTHACPTVYIDVWQSESAERPLLALVVEMIRQLKLLDEGRAASVAEQELVALLGAVQEKNSSDRGDKVPDNGPIAEYQQQVSLIGRLRLAVRDYIRALSGQGKVFVLIDELDRCRPSYAVAMLEVIKHYLSIPELVFVVTTDTAQLSHSIQAAYGYHFDGTAYLSHFFSRSANLPQPDRRQLVTRILTDKQLVSKLSGFRILPPVSSGEEGIEQCAELLTCISDAYQLKRQQLAQLVDKLDSLLIFYQERQQAGQPPQLFNFISLLVLLLEQGDERYHGVYKERHHTICRMFYGREYQIPEFRSETAFNTKITHYLPEPVRSDCKAHLDVAWEFVNGFTHSIQFKHEQFTLGDMVNSVTLEGRSPAECEVVSHYLQAMRQLQEENGDVYLWQRDDYFNASELASHLI